MIACMEMRPQHPNPKPASARWRANSRNRGCEKLAGQNLAVTVASRDVDAGFGDKFRQCQGCRPCDRQRGTSPPYALSCGFSAGCAKPQ
jgi:hypothetical protein